MKLRIALTVILALSLSLMTCIAFAGEEAAVAEEEVAMPDAASLLDGYVEATGGKSAYDKIQNRKTTGTIGIPAQGLSLEFTAYESRPNLRYIKASNEALGSIERGTNGEVAWEKQLMMGPRVMEGDERDMTLEDSKLDAIAYWRDNFDAVKTLGVEDVNERDCYKVEVTKKTGKPQLYFFDKEDRLLRRISFEAPIPMGEITVSTDLNDYREIDGILLPHKSTQSAMGQIQEILVESVSHNVEIPADRFALPEEIEALVE